MKNPLILVLAIAIMLSSFFFLPFNKETLFFSNNTANLRSPIDSKFTLESDSDLSFKVASSQLEPNTFIQLTHLDSGKIYLDYSGEEINDMTFNKLPAGRYGWKINYTKGFMNFAIRIVQSKP